MSIRSHRRRGRITGRAKRRGVLLVLTLFALALAAALVAPLGSASGLAALEARGRQLDQRHALAVESVIALLPQLLTEDRELLAALDDHNAATLTFALNDLTVTALVQEESAKFPLPLAVELAARTTNPSPLTLLATTWALPTLGYSTLMTVGGSRSNRSGIACLDDAFANPNDRDIYGTPTEPAAWSRYVTPLRTRTNLRRALPAVVDAAVADLAPGAGTQLVGALRGASGSVGLEDALTRLGLTGAEMRQLRERVSDQPAAWSLLVRSSCNGVTRQSYVLLEGPHAERTLVVWEVAP